MPNEQYQSLFGLAGDALRKQFLDGAPSGVAELVADVPDDGQHGLVTLVTDLGVTTSVPCWMPTDSATR
jgi:pyruvate dehydrogenase E1 component